MNIYKVERTDDWSYDDYDSFVCTASTAKEARGMHPDRGGSRSGWVSDKESSTLKITLIGVTLNDNSILAGEIILASFNAG